MKTKRLKPIFMLILALMMLASVISVATLAAFAADGSNDEPVGCIRFSSTDSFTLQTSDGKYWNEKLEYSINGSAWTTWNGTDTLSFDEDDSEYILCLRGKGNTRISGTENGGSSKWVLTGTNIACTGNIENLLDYEAVKDGDHPDMESYCFYEMFYECTALTTAPTLPAEDLADHCYQNMFALCTSLTAAPALPAETLAEGCYQGMFSDCTSLTEAPALPATTLAKECYNIMFGGCTSLTVAPAALPAETLADCCYDNMFAYCTSLAVAPTLPATTLANYCYQNMFVGCSSLIVAPKLRAKSLAEGCYCGMFMGCSSLTVAPALPAETLANKCYEAMFAGCADIQIVAGKNETYCDPWSIPAGLDESGKPIPEGLSELADWNYGMLEDTGGTFTDDPEYGKIYYQKFIHTHCICGKTNCPDAATHGAAVNFDKALTATGGELAGNYCLSGNVKLEHTIIVAEGTTLNICLNGYALEGNGTERVIAVNNGGVLNLCDCNGSDSAHKFTVNDASKLWEYAGEWGASDSEGTSIKKVTGGVITGGFADGSDHYGGGGVFIRYINGTAISTVNMYNITLAGNKAQSSGGGVQNAYGILNMYNVTVAGNTAASGGGIAFNGNSGSGGLLSIHGGTISDNTTGASYNNNGGGIYAYGGDVLLKDVKVSGNAAGTHGGGVCCENCATLSISGKVQIVDNTANSVRDNVWLKHQYTSASVKPKFPESTEYSFLYIVGELNKDTSIGITKQPSRDDGGTLYPVKVVEVSSGETPYVLSSTDVKYFFADNDAQHIEYNGSASCLDLAEGAPAPPHTHSWSYTTDGTTITAACIGEGDCAYKSAGISITPNVAACAKIYDGTACTGATIDGIADWTAQGLTAPEISYKGVSPTSYSETADCPVNAGTYKATIAVGDKTAEAEFTISKASQNLLTVRIISPAASFYGSPMTNLSVSGAAESPTITFYYDYFDLDARVGFRVCDKNATILDAGSYYFYAILGETANYKETRVNGDSRIYVMAAPMMISASNVSVTFDGEEHGITLTGVPDGATVKYGTVSGTYNLDECPKFKNASDTPYTVYYKVTKANYEDFTGSATVTVAKREITVSGIAVTSKAFDGTSAATLEYANAVLDGKLASDVLSVTATGTYRDANVGTAKTVDITDITLTGADKDNYKLKATGQQTTASGNITRKTVQTTDVTVPTASGTLTYGDKLSSATLSAGWVWADGTTVPTVISSGYTAYYAISDDANYDWSGIEGYDPVNHRLARTVSVTVGKANGKVTIENDISKIFDGSGVDSPEKSYYGTGIPQVEYKGIDEPDSAYNIVAPFNAGTYIVRVTVPEDDNFKEAFGTKEFTISRRDVTVTADDKTKAYGESDAPLTYTPTGLVDDDTLTGITITRVAGEDVNTYDITASQTAGANPNYNITFNKGTYTITKATAVITVDKTPIVKAYGDTWTLPVATSTFGTVFADKTVADLVNVGTYTVTYTVEGTENYNGATATVSVTVNKQKVAKPTADTTAFVYNGEEQTYTLKTDDRYTISGAVKGTDVSTYTATVALTDKANYEWADGTTADLTFDWEIGKATAVITVDRASIVKTYGETWTLPEATTTFGTVLVDKTVADLEKVGSYTVTYTVEGADNYNGATATVSVTINKQKVAKPTADTTAFVYTGEEQTYTLAADARYIVTGAVKGTDVSTYSATVALIDKANYEWADGTDTDLSFDWKIAKANVTVTADDKSKTYGDSDVALTSTIEGLEDGDTLDVTLVREAGESVGTYKITASAEDANYNITFVDGTFTVNPKSIEALSVEVELGDALTDNGAEQTQGVKKVTVDGVEVEYDIIGNKATAPGVYTMQITVKGNYAGTFEQKYIVLEKETKTDDFAETKTEEGKSDITVDDGRIVVDIKTDDKNSDTKLVSEGKELMPILNADELAKVAGGDTANIWVDVKDATDTITDASKEQIASKLNDDGKLKMGAYIDISLFKQLSSEAEPTQVHNLARSIKVSIVIPDELVKTARTFCIIRNHEGTVELIDGEYDAATRTFTFETDKFSDYGIAYEDHCAICHDRAPMFLGLCLFAWLVIIVVVAVAAIAVGIILVKKKQGKKSK